MDLGKYSYTKIRTHLMKIYLMRKCTKHNFSSIWYKNFSNNRLKQGEPVLLFSYKPEKLNIRRKKKQ